MRLSLLRNGVLTLALAGLALCLSAGGQASGSQTDSVRRISKEEVSALLKGKKSKVFLVDVRDAAAFKAGHIKGAVNIPYGDTASRLKEFPTNRLIVTYCS